MKKQFYAAMAALMVGGFASAQTVSVIGLDGNAIATYDLDQVNQIVFTPGEEPEPNPNDPVIPDLPDNAVVVELTEGNQYEGIVLPIDADAIAEELDLPSLSTNYMTIYAKQGDELSNNYTAAGDGGFWFDVNGTICGWNTEGCAVYAEFYNDLYEDGTTAAWLAGQFPGALKAGDVLVVTIVMVSNFDEDAQYEMPICFVINAREAEEVVYEGATSCEASCTNDYVPTVATFNADEVKAALGIENMSEAQVVLKNPDGSTVYNTTANNGFWMDATGTSVAWGGDTVWFIEFDPESNEAGLNVGQGNCEPYTEYQAVFGFLANSKIAWITVNYKTTDDQRPAEEPTE
ncbi:MAG: DUF4859 domain-containing protein [Bacteroidales bacterium]|nr:DUF4859 domain-containing protein [Bacteroidales bacterium]